jgi:hypothetical protein
VFAMLMMLAFLVDQTQQLSSKLFQSVLNKEACRIRLWEHMRALFYTFEFTCMEEIYTALLYGFSRTQAVILKPP